MEEVEEGVRRGWRWERMEVVNEGGGRAGRSRWAAQRSEVRGESTQQLINTDMPLSALQQALKTGNRWR